MSSVMIVGGGAREHAISKAYEKSRDVDKIIVAPGNDFIGFQREKEVIIEKSCSLRDPESILSIAVKYKPDLVDVAQDDALAAGTVDLLKENGFHAFGPTKQQARIEWDKTWSRKLMTKYSIPCPDYHIFSDESPAIDYMNAVYSANPGEVLYVKASGLCSGKGALKSTSLNEAISNIKEMKNFSDAGKTFLIETGLEGEEFSYYAITDGTDYIPFKPAQDNKRLYNFDEGLQTGGMGSISPAMVTEPFTKEIEDVFISRAIGSMSNEESGYSGILYFGGIVRGEDVSCIEYNSRWGDPECQSILPGIITDYFTLATACIENRISHINFRQDDKTRVCVVGASRGYPEDFSSVRGKRIYGLEDAMHLDGIKIFGSGISIKDNEFYADGGRLFSVVAEGNNIIDARQKAYSAMASIHVEGNNLHYRTDIGWRDAERVRNGFV